MPATITKQEAKETLDYIDGGIDAAVYDYTHNSVLMFTENYVKVEFLSYIGLVVNYHGYYKHTYSSFYGNRRMYVVELVKLDPLTGSPQYTEIMGQLYAERNYIESCITYVKDERGWGRRRKQGWISRIDTEKLVYLRDSIEFIQSHPRLSKTEIWIDDHDGNIMLDRVTGTPVVIDAINMAYREAS